MDDLLRRTIVDLRSAFAALPDNPAIRATLLHQASNAPAEGVKHHPAEYKDSLGIEAYHSAGSRDGYMRLSPNGSYRFTSIPTLDAEGTPMCNSAGDGFSYVLPASRQIHLTSTAGAGTFARMLALVERGGKMAMSLHLLIGDEPGSWSFPDGRSYWCWLLFEAAWRGCHPTLRAKRWLWGEPHHSYAYTLALFDSSVFTPKPFPERWSRRLPDAYFSTIDEVVWGCRDICDLLLAELDTFHAPVSTKVASAANRLLNELADWPRECSVISDPANCEVLRAKLDRIADVCHSVPDVLKYCAPEYPPVSDPVWQYFSVTVNFSPLQQKRIALGEAHMLNGSDRVDTMRVQLADGDATWLKTIANTPQSSEHRTTERKPKSLFISYSHRDELLKDQLCTHLSTLKRDHLIQDWHDRRIPAGNDWKNTIDEKLNSADVILLLVSPGFIESRYCYEIEMARAMERHERQEATVIPIVLKPVAWPKGAFTKLQMLPKDAKPITKWKNRDDAFASVVQGIRAAL